MQFKIVTATLCYSVCVCLIVCTSYIKQCKGFTILVDVGITYIYVGSLICFFAKVGVESEQDHCTVLDNNCYFEHS